MDRPLDSQYLKDRRRKRMIGGGAALAVLAILLIWGPGWIRPTISRSRIRTARVEAGPIEAVITASGTVVPEVEEVISSPIDARVVRILARAGAVLTPGQPLVELDTTEARLAVERLAQNLALKENQRSRTTLDLERSLNDLDSQARSKELQLQFYQSQLARNRQLSAEGLLSVEQLRLSELTEAQAVIELKRIESERTNARQSNTAMLDGLALEMATLRNELEAARRQLELAAPRSDRTGVLTWALTAEGATIRKGDVIARIADLGSFRVEATVSDVHARRLAAGLPVQVKVGDDTLGGTVATILPTIQNGIITMQVALADSSSRLLRSNMRVDVLVITGHKDSVLRIKKGPFADGEGGRQAFVVHGKRAVRTPIELGLASFDDFEVVQGLALGDEVIISDMRDWIHVREIRIR
ncbi:MAG: HlyD family efflux transporter periplasmic adaptor subunit [Acidobacteria bacterium]|nr:HlyD family efflux transporter periplasmic adaptor subunit [Acidobacteriota bacterium]